tara:strand:- start:3761 stop:5149 length:1389 start_codon:yes stop_codon:yes gene_type:complete
MIRDITTDDIVKLTEIKIKRISKYNSFKADELISKIEEDVKEVKHHIAHLTEYTIAYFDSLLEKYGKGKERRTIISSFETIKMRKVVMNNAKLYVDYKEGFVGTGMKKNEFISECSDIDDVIAFMKDGTFKVVRISDKVFVGKNIIHAAVWKKGDERTTYNLIYVDAQTGRSMAKRFNVKSITREKEYNLTKGAKGSKVLYFTVNPNGEGEIVNVQLSQSSTAKKKNFDIDLGEIGIKGRASGGNIVTKYPVKKVTQVSVGSSSLAAVDVWVDDISGRVNTEERGRYLGAFEDGDQLIAIHKDGSYELSDLLVDKKYDHNSVLKVFRYRKGDIISALHFDAEKGRTMVKRFSIETSKLDTKYPFISEADGSKLYFASVHPNPKIKYSYKTGGEKHEATLDFVKFIDVKGWKALGNRLIDHKVLKVTKLHDDMKVNAKEEVSTKNEEKDNNAISTGDTIELDL